jgi:hypothetical protein
MKILFLIVALGGSMPALYCRMGALGYRMGALV